MLRIGLTGSIGSGKSTVSEIFSILKIPVYSADFEAKRFMSYPYVITQIVKLFGKESINMNGEINRQYLAEIVFKNPDLLNALNKIIHPLVKSDFDCWTMLHHAHPYIIQEAAILFESGFDKYFDEIITVTAPEELRIKRVMQRDHITENLVRLRIQNQISDEEKVRRANYVIMNNELQLLIPQVLAIHQQILGIL